MPISNAKRLMTMPMMVEFCTTSFMVYRLLSSACLLFHLVKRMLLPLVRRVAHGLFRFLNQFLDFLGLSACKLSQFRLQHGLFREQLLFELCSGRLSLCPAARRHREQKLCDTARNPHDRNGRNKGNNRDRQ